MATTFAVPDGRVAMAATTYTGTGATLAVSNAVNTVSFQPDFVWMKGRSGATDHALYDSVRGATFDLVSNSTAAETTQTTGLTTFGAAGFTVGALAKVNTSAATYVGWQWNAGGTTVTNGTGTISSQVRANTDAGFSVVTYTGTGANATVGHGLGVAPSMIIVKKRSAARSWIVWHTSFASSSSTSFMYLDSAGSLGGLGSANFWNNTASTATLLNIGVDNSDVSATYVAYCWAPVAGYSAFGSYTGNGLADGTFIYTGFRPRYVLIKRTDASADWFINDTSREPYNLMSVSMRADTADTEASGGGLAMDALSNGFKMRDTGSGSNASGGTFIYAAYAENPLRYSNAR